MKMNLLSGGRLCMQRSIYYPDAAEHETLEMPVSCALIKHAQGNVLFDTGCSPEAITNGDARWGAERVKRLRPIFTPEDTVIHQLALAGLGVDDIDVVICSHFHPDHCGCNEHFRHATIICHTKDLELARSPEGPAHAYLPADWDHPMPIQTIDNDYDLFGDGRVVLLPMPGHTAGMLTALVTLDKSGRYFLASDAVSVRAMLDHRYAPANSWSVEATLASLEEIARIEREGAIVLCSHDDAQWKSLNTGAKYYD